MLIGVVVMLLGLLASVQVAQADHEDVIEEAIGIGDENTGERHTILDVGPDGADLLVSLATEGFDERGLIGLVFDPHYRKNGRFYTHTSEPLGPAPDFSTGSGGDHLGVIREWTVNDPRRLDATADPASSRVVLRVEQPQFNHNGGGLTFGPDGLLYIAFGDGGGRDDQGGGHAVEGNGQSLDDQNVLGKILRIDPRGSSSANGQYSIPTDNPFVGRDGADEIYAYGFRNPYRLAFDHGTGELYTGDVGQNDIEEIDLVVPGGNYGWPIKEGTFLFDDRGSDRGATTANSPNAPAGLIDPIAQYDHDEGTSITAGFVYRGSAIPELQGTYVFGELTAERNAPAGRLFQLDPAGELVEVLPANAQAMFVTGFGQDARGELYVVGLQPGDQGVSGVVYRLVPAR